MVASVQFFHDRSTVVEAVRVDDDRAAAARLASWCRGVVTDCGSGDTRDRFAGVTVSCTGGGLRLAEIGDWVVKGLDGVFMVVPDALFARMYVVAGTGRWVVFEISATGSVVHGPFTDPEMAVSAITKIRRTRAGSSLRLAYAEEIAERAAS